VMTEHGLMSPSTHHRPFWTEDARVFKLKAKPFDTCLVIIKKGSQLLVT